MEFTYKAFTELINLLKEKQYQFANYKNYGGFSKPVIFRHDIDLSLDKALELARLEYKNNVKATYFVLLSTDFYNVFSKKSNDILKEILNLGHEIGLHFDEKRYEIVNAKQMEDHITHEKNILGGIGQKIEAVSMHRPSKWVLENDVEFNSVINSYSKTFTHDFKYLSDSRMHWREDVLLAIRSDQHLKLHILTHPFWYSNAKKGMKEAVSGFISEATGERYWQLKDNIRDLEEILKVGE